MNGIKKGDITIGVDYLPYRKKPCLVVIDGNSETKYASFNNVYSAVEFMNILAEFVGIYSDRLTADDF